MYRAEDIKVIEQNINKIKDEAAIEYKKSNEPTLNKISEIYTTIKNYLKRKKRIVYGGFAQNILLTSKNPEESFYKTINGVFYNWPNVADIEFYSSTPLADIIELTEELHKAGFKYIEGKEGVHSETYKIFVEFINFCDISYIPANINKKLPTINVNGIICAHPHFMMIDSYRISTDPMTSYWILDKTIYRFQKLIKYYPIDHTFVKKKIKLKSNQDILNFIRKEIIHNSKLVVVGFYAFDYYMEKVSNDLKISNYPYYEIISMELEKDARNILKILKSKYKKNITTKEYHPFFQFTDKKIEFFNNNQLVLRLFGNNNRCTVYNYSDKKLTHFGTFNLVFLYLLFDYFYAIIVNNKNDKELYQALIAKLYDGRIEYLNNNNLNVVDVSPFQDFTFKCHGITEETIRSAMIKGILDRNKGKYKFNYKPKGTIGKIPEYNFLNTSGNQNLNKKNLILIKNI